MDCGSLLPLSCVAALLPGDGCDLKRRRPYTHRRPAGWPLKGGSRLPQSMSRSAVHWGPRKPSPHCRTGVASDLHDL